MNSSDPAEHIAIEIAKRLTGRWIPPDGIPSGYIFDYEKDIVEFPSTPDATSKVCRTILPLKS